MDNHPGKSRTRLEKMGKVLDLKILLTLFGIIVRRNGSVL
jgi:hypothetical protein